MMSTGTSTSWAVVDNRKGTKASPKRVFLSHASADAADAEFLAAELRRGGFDVASNRSDLTGRSVLDEVRRQVVVSDAQLLMLTDRSARNPNLYLELGMAAHLRKPTLVVLEESVKLDLPGLFPNQRYLVVSDWREGAVRARSELEKMLSVPKKSPIAAKRSSSVAKKEAGRGSGPKGHRRVSFVVAPAPGGTWEIAREGRDRTGVFRTKSAAVASARSLARAQGSADLVVRDRSGRIQRTERVGGRLAHTRRAR
jgi:hypothetical protein